MKNLVRVLIADDHPLFVSRLETMLEAEERIEVVGSARDGAEAVELAGALGPDVVVLDVNMPRMDGLEAIVQIRAREPAPRVVMLTGSDSSTTVSRARTLGAAAYVVKDRIDSDLLGAILPCGPG